MRIKSFLVSIVFFFGTYGLVNAECIKNTIDREIVAKQPEPMTLADVSQHFGQGCLGGMTAMTYQYSEKTGKEIWFWLKNKPEPAFASFQKGVAGSIEVQMVVVFDKNKQGSEEIIWPRALAGQSYENALKDAYFSSSR